MATYTNKRNAVLYFPRDLHWTSLGSPKSLVCSWEVPLLGSPVPPPGSPVQLPGLLWPQVGTNQEEVKLDDFPKQGLSIGS